MFLTEDDIPIYAPTVTLVGDALEGAIAIAQSIAESPAGASRPLEIQPVTEVLPLNEFQACFLTRSPILEISLVEARSGKFKDMTGYPYQAAPWHEIPETNWLIDVNELTVIATEAFFNGWNVGYGVRARICLSEAKVTYTSGYDPTDDTDPDTRYIKSHLGQILTYLQGSNYQGVKRLEVPFREFEIEYANAAPATIPDALLMPFQKFQPITYCS